MIDKIGIGEIHEELRDYQKAALKGLRAIDEKKKERFSTIINLPSRLKLCVLKPISCPSVDKNSLR